VQALLDETIVARSAELKERALRRRCAKIAAELPREALARDLALVVTGRDEARQATDEVLKRYRVDRAVFHMAPPLAAALARETSRVNLGASTWRTIARASVRASALTTSGRPGADDEIAPAAARAALTSVVEELGSRAVAPRPAPTARGLAAELEEIAALLQTRA
jgi:hypothetical protein